MAINASIENGVAQVTYESQGTKKVKNITADALGKAIMESLSSAKSCDIFPLGLRIKGEAGDKVIVGYEFPERVVELPFNREGSVVKIKSVVPWGLTFIEFTKTREGLQWSRFYQFALKGPIANGDTQLFVWPGSNVYDSFNCCIGDIKVPKLQGIEQTGGLPNLFYNGVSNNDLSRNRFLPLKVGDRTINFPYELYKHLEVKQNEQPKEFPYQILREATKLSAFLSSGGYM